VNQSRIHETVDELASPSEYQCDDPHIRLVVQTNQDHTLLFVANLTGLPRETVVRFPGVLHLQRVWGEAGNCSGEGELTLKLEPYTVEIWEVLCD
jgi:hypothetical protein